jgi:hypothetical protein
LLTLLYHIVNPLVGFITPQPNGAGGRPCRVANSKPNCQRSTVPLRYTAKPDLRHLSDQDRLDPEPGRTPTPRMGLVRLSRNTQHMRLQPPVKRKPEDFSRHLTRFYVNSAWVNFSSIPPSDGVAGRHVLQNLDLVDRSYLECAQQLSRDRMAYAELNVKF